MEKTTGTDRMHGSIFVLLKRFVEYKYNYSAWVKLLEDTGIKHPPYQMHGVYPTEELFAIVQKASEQSGVPAYDLMEQYGQFIVPDLMLIYSKYIGSGWRTYQMLLNTEEAMHGAVRREDGRTSPPRLLVTKKGGKQLIVDYHSKRRMAGVAVGIIKGIASYFNESDIVQVTRVTPDNEERVQIRVDFLN
jgi:hypothetical protein